MSCLSSQVSNSIHVLNVQCQLQTMRIRRTERKRRYIEEINGLTKELLELDIILKFTCHFLIATCRHSFPVMLHQVKLLLVLMPFLVIFLPNSMGETFFHPKPFSQKFFHYKYGVLPARKLATRGEFQQALDRVLNRSMSLIALINLGKSYRLTDQGDTLPVLNPDESTANSNINSNRENNDGSGMDFSPMPLTNDPTIAGNVKEQKCSGIDMFTLRRMMRTC